MSDDINIKIVMIGPMAVGKTSICNYMKYKKFNPHYQVTVGAGLHDFKKVINGKKVAVQLWDTAGMERHRSIGSIYYRNSDIALFVFDLSDEKSIDELDSYYEEFSFCNKNPFYGIACANKLDICNPHVMQKGKEWADCNMLDLFTICAKTGEGVDDMINKAIERALENKVCKQESELKLSSQNSSCC